MAGGGMGAAAPAGTQSTSGGYNPFDNPNAQAFMRSDPTFAAAGGGYGPQGAVNGLGNPIYEQILSIDKAE